MTKYDPRKNAEGYNDPTPYAAEKHMMAQIRGKQARVAGGYFENIIVIPFPDKKYSIIYADPPWSYSDSGCSGAAAAQYATMSINELKQLPVNPAGGGIAADDCVLFMWATYPKMQEALDLIEAWGFKYKSIAFQWIKQNRSGNGYFFGLGRWTRGNTEPCLIAIKGKPKRISAGVGQLVFSPLRRHSQKPAEVRDKIVELMGDLPRIELFAREAAPGWDAWGNEAPTPEVKDVPADSVELAGKEETHEPDNQRDPAPQL